MDIPTDLRELLELFVARGVEFLVVGAHALAFHGAPRATGDIDLFINPSPENAARIYAALETFGFGSLGLKPEDFQAPDSVVQLGVEPNRVDLLTSLSGLSWQDAWAHRQAGSCGGVAVAFLGRADLIANKRAAGRKRDLGDIEALGER